MQLRFFREQAFCQHHLFPLRSFSIKPFVYSNAGYCAVSQRDTFQLSSSVTSETYDYVNVQLSFVPLVVVFNCITFCFNNYLFSCNKASHLRPPTVKVGIWTEGVRISLELIVTKFLLWFLAVFFWKGFYYQSVVLCKEEKYGDSASVSIWWNISIVIY